MKINRSFGTHNGSFHADEVTACSLLLLFDLIDREKIQRTRDPDILNKCEYVCDVGGVYDPALKRFDHHQAEYKGSMSSAGMILLYLKSRGILGPQTYDHFNKSLILGVDAHDNGVAKLETGTASFSQIVSNFLPIEYDVTTQEMENCFFQALDFVLAHLKRLQQRLVYMHACQSTVKEKMKERGKLLIFDEALPWMENFFDLGGERHPAQFVIMPSADHWKLRGIPPSLADRMRVRHPLPESWAGLRDHELQQISGVPGAIFCHKGRFISIWKTKEDALNAYKAIHENNL
jgi:uncharacterized UPF0160 family protein